MESLVITHGVERRMQGSFGRSRAAGASSRAAGGSVVPSAGPSRAGDCLISASAGSTRAASNLPLPSGGLSGVAESLDSSGGGLGGIGFPEGRSAAGGAVADRPGGGPGHRPRPPKLYRIGEVVAYSGMSRQTVHNYTAMGLLHEVRWTDGGHRLYDESVFQRLDEIAEMKMQGKSLQDLREHFARMDGS